MEPEGLLPLSQEPATCPYPEPEQSSPCPPTHFLKVLINILPSTPGSSKWSLSFRCPHQNHVYISSLPQTRYMPRPSHLLDFITRTILGEHYSTLSFSLCSFLHSPLTSSLLGPNNLPSTLFSNTLSLRSSLSVTKFHTHITQ